MPYARWYMTEDAAATLTGVDAITQDELEAAEEDLVDVLGWRPSASSYSTTFDVDGFPVDRRAEAFGKAVAWQAAHRQTVTPTADDQAVAVTDESVAEWSAGYARPRVDDPAIAARARSLLARAGWLARGRSGVSLP